MGVRVRVPFCPAVRVSEEALRMLDAAENAPGVRVKEMDPEMLPSVIVSV